MDFEKFRRVEEHLIRKTQLWIEDSVVHRQVHTPFDHEAPPLVVGALPERDERRLAPVEHPYDERPPLLETCGRVVEVSMQPLDAGHAVVVSCVPPTTVMSGVSMIGSMTLVSCVGLPEIYAPTSPESWKYD